MLETIRIKSTHPETQGQFVNINKDDFDAEKHELFDASVRETVGPSDAATDADETTSNGSGEAQEAPARRGRKPKAQ